MTEQMKPSGIAWMGDIPYKWNCKQIAFMSSSRSGGTPDRNNLNYWEDGTIPWMSSGEVNKINVYETDEKITELAIINSSAKIVKANAVMVALNGQGKTKGMSAILRIDSACNQSLCAFTCFEGVLHYEYLFWCFQAMYTYLRQMSGDDVRDGLAASYVKKQKIPVPKYQEQVDIAKFLNAQCAKIDGIIADIEKQIETLQKYKKSLITETVTKGLNKSAQMKDSSIEWIGEIPSSYVVRRLKYMTTIKDGTHDTPDYIYESTESYPLITPKYIDYNTKKIDFETAKHISKIDFENIHKRSDVEYGDIIMPMIGTIGNPVIVNTHNPFAIKNVALFKTNNDLIKCKYIYYQFYSNTISEQFSIMARGGVQSFVSLEILGNLLFVDCNSNEKEKIVNYLDSKCNKIDEIIVAKQQKLDAIAKHKKSLIYEYVTGKKRVTEVN